MLRFTGFVLQGTSSLTDDPVWLLGLWYGLQDADSNKGSMTPEVCLLPAGYISTVWKAA